MAAGDPHHYVGPARRGCPRRGDAEAGPLCRLVLDPRWVPALDGLEPSAELQLLYWMHEARRDPRPALACPHTAPRGPFALRAPTRPNPIASSRVVLVARDGAVLDVRGLDCVSGTPLLDIKPWRAG